MASTKEKCISSKMRDRLYIRIRNRLGNLASSIRGCLAVIRDRLLLFLGMDRRFVKPEKYDKQSSLNLFCTPNHNKNRNCDTGDELSVEKSIQCVLRCCFRGCGIDDDEENSYTFNIPSDKSPRLKSPMRRNETGDFFSANTFSGDESTPTPTPNRRRRARNTKRSPTSFRRPELGVSPTPSDHHQEDSWGSHTRNLPNKKDECATEDSSASESHAINITQVRLLFHRYGSDPQIPKEEENGNIADTILARADQTLGAIEKGFQSLSSGEGDCNSRRVHDYCVYSNIHGATRANLDNFRFEESFAEPELIIRDEQSFIRICPGVGKLSFAQMLKILNRLLKDYADACVKVSFPNSDTEICVSSEYKLEHPCVLESPQPKEQLTSDKCTIMEIQIEMKKEADDPKSIQDATSNKDNAIDELVSVCEVQSSIKITQPTTLKNLVNTLSETLQMKTPDKNRQTTKRNILSDSGGKNTVPWCKLADDANAPTPKENLPTKQSHKTIHMESISAKDEPAPKEITLNMHSGPTEGTRNKMQAASAESAPNPRLATLVEKETKENYVNVNKADDNASQTKGFKDSKTCNKGTPSTFCEEGAEKFKVSGLLNDKETEKKCNGRATDSSTTPLSPKKENWSDKSENKTQITPPSSAKTRITPPCHPPSNVKLQLLQKKISELERVEEREKQLHHVEKLRNESLAAIQAHRKRTSEMHTSLSDQKSPSKTVRHFDSDSSENEDSRLNDYRCDVRERERNNGEYLSNTSDDDNEVECNFKVKAKSPAQEMTTLRDYEYYEDLNMSVETEKLTEERVGKLGDMDAANEVSQSPGKWGNSPDENSKHSEPWRRRNAPLYQNDGAFELASHYRIDGRVEAEMSKRGSRDAMLHHKKKKKRRGIPNRHLQKEDKPNVNFDEEQFHALEDVKDDASFFTKEEKETSRDKSSEEKADELTEKKPIELIEDTRHFEQIPMEVIMRKAKDDDDIDNKYAVRGRANEGKNRDKKKKKQRPHSQKPILVCGLPTPHKTKH